MPSPWLMARKSGLYCRVFVPADLRPTIGQRFLVRSLGERVRDQARLIAAQYALGIGELFRAMFPLVFPLTTCVPCCARRLLSLPRSTRACRGPAATRAWPCRRSIGSSMPVSYTHLTLPT